MNNEHTHFDSVAEQLTIARCTQMPPETGEWSSASALHTAIRTDTLDQLSHLSTGVWTKRYFSAIKLATENDYRQSLITTPHGELLCGIHFKGGNREEPFVEIVAWTFPDDELAHGIRLALDRYIIFKPRWARVLTSHTSDLLSRLTNEGFVIKGDQVIAAARLSELAQRPKLISEDLLRLEVILISELPWATRFVEHAYECHIKTNPTLDGLVFPASYEELQQCVSDGRLARWTLDGDPLGLIAVRRQNEYGLHGYLAIESVVDPSVTLRGTAAAAQAKLARELAIENPDLTYYGTIDFQNSSSRKTALKVGRTEIASWSFVSPSVS